MEATLTVVGLYPFPPPPPGPYAPPSSIPAPPPPALLDPPLPGGPDRLAIASGLALSAADPASTMRATPFAIRRARSSAVPPTTEPSTTASTTVSLSRSHAGSSLTMAAKLSSVFCTARVIPCVDHTMWLSSALLKVMPPPLIPSRACACASGLGSWPLIVAVGEVVALCGLRAC